MLREWLAEEGFHLSAVAPATPLDAARNTATAALEQGHLQGMDWVTAAWIARSADPERFLPGAKNVVLVAFNRFMPGDHTGQLFAFIVIAVAAAEVAVGLAIVIGLFRLKGTVETDKADLLKH